MMAIKWIAGPTLRQYSSRRLARYGRRDESRRGTHECVRHVKFHDKIRSLPGATEARAMIVKKAQEYLDHLAKESGADVALQIDLGEAYRKLGSVQGDVRSPNLGNPSAAMENYRKAEPILRPLAAGEPGNPRIQRNLAMTYKQIGDLQAYTSGLPMALETYRRSAAAWEALLAIGPPGADDLNQAGITHADAGRIQVKMMDLTGALESLRRATGLFERGIALDSNSRDLVARWRVWKPCVARC